jgi:hypothetical protein
MGTFSKPRLAVLFFTLLVAALALPRPAAAQGYPNTLCCHSVNSGCSAALGWDSTPNQQYPGNCGAPLSGADELLVLQASFPNSLAGAQNVEFLGTWQSAAPSGAPAGACIGADPDPTNDPPVAPAACVYPIESGTPNVYASGVAWLLTSSSTNNAALTCAAMNGQSSCAFLRSNAYYQVGSGGSASCCELDELLSGPPVAYAAVNMEGFLPTIPPVVATIAGAPALPGPWSVSAAGLLLASVGIVLLRRRRAS